MGKSPQNGSVGHVPILGKNGCPVSAWQAHKGSGRFCEPLVRPGCHTGFVEVKKFGGRKVPGSTPQNRPINRAVGSRPAPERY